MLLVSTFWLKPSSTVPDASRSAFVSGGVYRRITVSPPRIASRRVRDNVLESRNATLSTVADVPDRDSVVESSNATLSTVADVRDKVNAEVAGTADVSIALLNPTVMVVPVISAAAPVVGSGVRIDAGFRIAVDGDHQ